MIAGMLGYDGTIYINKFAWFRLRYAMKTFTVEIAHYTMILSTYLWFQRFQDFICVIRIQTRICKSLVKQQLGILSRQCVTGRVFDTFSVFKIMFCKFSNNGYTGYMKTKM